MEISLEQKYIVENYKNIILLEDLKYLLDIIEENKEKIELNDSEKRLIEIISDIINLDNEKGD